MRANKSSELRNARVLIKNQAYLTIMVTNKRNPVFLDVYSGWEWVSVLKDTSLEVKTICYVIKPDYLQWLMRFKGKQTLSKII